MRPKEIKIYPVLNGYIVQVGCQSVVFESREKLILELGHYYAKPLETEKEYLKNAVNPMPEDPIACDTDVRSAQTALRAVDNRSENTEPTCPAQQPYLGGAYAGQITPATPRR